MLVLWISKILVRKILMEKSNRKNSTVRDTKSDYPSCTKDHRVFPDHVFFSHTKFPTKLLLVKFYKVTVTVNLNGWLAGTKGKPKKIGAADRTPRETLE